MAAVRRVLLVVGAALAVVVVAEVGVRVALADLPAVEEWPDATTAAKVAQMEALGCADVVFVGNSVARDGFDPDTFTAADPDGRTAYNAALDAAGPAHLARWLDDQVLPRLSPGTVVWALTSPDLHDDAPAPRAAEEAYRTSIGGRDDLVGRLQRPLVAASALVRHREALTDPATVWETLTGPPPPTRPTGLIGPRGQGRSRAELTYRPGDPVTAAFVRQQLLAGYDLGGDQLAAARALLADLAGRGVQVTLVLPPVTDEFVGFHPGPDDWERYRASVDDLARDTGTPLLDLSDDGHDGWFADTHHLNGTGAAAFTAEVARRLPRGPAAC